MTIIMIEATAEELSANRTVMDSLNDALSKFTGRICGISNLDFTKALENLGEQEEGDKNE